MAEGPHPLGTALHAVLEEPEPGLFRAAYRGEFNPDHAARHQLQELPDFHLGTDAASVKLWVEQMAVSLGYAGVVWDALPERK